MSNDSTITWLPMGAILEGRWQIQGKLGRGGFATVYHGQHVKLEREAAIKVLDIQATPEEMRVFEERFLREAKLAAKLDHPNIVQVLDYGMTRRDGITKPFIVMERLTGHDLEHELIHHGPLSRDRARKLFHGALDALAVCHQQGVVHRDLKPSNLFIVHPRTGRERLVVLDFGIARAFEDPHSRLTATSHFTGTPAYLAPEYISDQHVSPALDVYQMGLILSESITGTPVVQASAPLGYLMAHCNGQQHIPSHLRNTSVGEILSRAVRVNPEERPVDAGQLRTELEQANWDELPERWDTAQKSSVVGTFPDAALHTQDGVNPWGDTAAPTATPPELMPRKLSQEIATDPISFDATHTQPDMVAPSSQGGLKIAIAAIFALGVLLGGGALMLIALKPDLPDAPQEPPHATISTPPSAEQDTAEHAEEPVAQPVVTPRPVLAKPAIVESPPEPASVKPAIKEVIVQREPMELVEVSPLDKKLATGHQAIASLTIHVDKNHLTVLNLLEELGEGREVEVVSYFSNISDEYTLAATHLERLAGHAPVIEELDHAAQVLARITHRLADLARRSYTYRMTREGTYDSAQVLALVEEWEALIKEYHPVHERFLTAIIAQDHALLKARFDRTDARSGPLMYHYHGLMLSLARAMEQTQKHGHTNKSTSFLHEAERHATAFAELDLMTYKEQLSSAQRNAIHGSSRSAQNAIPYFNAYQKALKKYGSSSKLKSRQKVTSAHDDLYRTYNFALKKYTERPEL